MTHQVEPDGVIDETNFRETAKKAVGVYGKKGMMADELFWSCILGFYERAIEDLESKVEWEKDNWMEHARNSKP